ncbi:oxidoreductase family protein [Marinomonas algicola]|uniref:oxidoreductase family protein n=1 Tax=Marinomonas algicola TaxID=2773454 RepID=UPI00174D8358|nr:oxidoreductase family protein [Marinomonas algicola]
MMTPEIYIKRQLNASSVVFSEVLQALWSDCGAIVRYSVTGVEGIPSVILKRISVPEHISHPRGWDSKQATDRKIHSYQVEKNWYQNWALHCDTASCVVAECYGVLSTQDNEVYILLEDLDVAGFSKRHSQLNVFECVPCLHWLATFHARFIQEKPSKDWPQGLWEKGTYWHLSTRQSEWQSMSEGEFKNAALQITSKLDNARFQTLVHGDAKVANFCFSDDGSTVSAVDFQYVGKGVGVQDLAYFLGSCLSEQSLQQHLDYLLDLYFTALSGSIISLGESPDLAEAVAKEWCDLFPVAWADFHRFILGWSPSHKKNTLFSRKMALKGLRMSV